MTVILRKALLRWHNPIARHPVAVLDYRPAPNSAPAPEPARIARLAAVIRAEIPSAAAPEGLDTAEAFILWAVRAIQQRWDVAPDVAQILPGAAPGERRLVYAYGDAEFAFNPGEAALGFTSAFDIRPEPAPTALAKHIARSVGVLHQRALVATSREMVRSAEALGIPWHRPSRRTRYVSLGLGAKARTMYEIMPEQQSVYGRSMAADKFLTCERLSAGGLPLGRFAEVRSLAEAKALAETVGFPLVVKPTGGAHGDGVQANIRDFATLAAAVEPILTGDGRALLQQQFPGQDHRILVLDGKVLHVARRMPPTICGDGTSTVSALIDRLNTDPRRGDKRQEIMNRVVVDAQTETRLRAAGLGLGSVLEAGRELALKRTANIATGGTAIDETARMHPENRRIAERAARLLGLRVAGVDLIIPDIARSWRETGGGICEVNHSPGLRPHQIASPGLDILAPVIRSTLEDGGTIPVAMVAGGPARVDACRALGRLLAAAGRAPGLALSEGAFLGAERVLAPSAGPHRVANAVLRDPEVETAVLEVVPEIAGQQGLAVAACDIAGLLALGAAVGPDLAICRKIAAAASTLVLDLDDAPARSLLSERAAEQVLGLSGRADGPLAAAHLAAGGRLVVADDRGLRLLAGGGELHLGPAPNPELQAAAALALGLGLAPDAVASALTGALADDLAGDLEGR